MIKRLVPRFLPSLFRRRAAPQPAVQVRPPYAVPNTLQRNRWKLAALLFFATFIYVFVFHLFGRFMIAQFLVPLGLLVLLIVWALPEREPPPTQWMTWLFFGFIGSLLLWPDYLAFAFPGLPWITALRLTGFPMVLLLFVAFSISPSFRKQLSEIHQSSRFVLICVGILTGFMFGSIVYSTELALTANKAVVYGVYLSAIFIVAAYVFRVPGRAMKLIYFWWGAAIFICLIALWESRLGHVPWYGHIPSFLEIEDESVQRMISPNARKATGIVRVQSKFRNPLGLAEFLGLTTPFVIYFAMTHRKLLVKLLAMLTLPLIFWIIVKTDSRLGSAAFMMSIVIYVGAWGILRWSSEQRSIFGPAITLAYPAFFAAFIAATFFVRRLEVMVWGGGAQAASDLARQIQWDTGIPKVLARPWGHGWGAAAEALGYRTGDTLTIDSYMLSLLMELGPLGFLVFFLPFIYIGIQTLKKVQLIARDEEIGLLIPICISFLNFMIIKTVLSEQENHPLVFMMMGMAVALFYRLSKEQETGTSVSESPAPLPEYHRRR